MPSFASLGVPESLVRALTKDGITTPFPIQTATLPGTLAGRDMLGRGRTGSGKTLAFAIPTIARLAGGHSALRKPRGLILAPTRELANQIAAVLEPLAAVSGLKITTIFGGVSQYRQEIALKAGVDIVVACPGRLEDLLKQKILTLDAVEITVLDEADHMADLGFLPGVKRIMAATPKRGQRMLFSATLDRGVDLLVKQFLSNPMHQSVDSETSPVEAMTHHVFTVGDAETKRLVVEHLASGTGRRLLFTRTKHQAKKLAKQLTAVGIPAVDLHGNLSQPARERNLEAFSHGSVRVLVATDIAARGIHVDDIELVVHVDPPAEHKAYTHRSGRTARAGSGGDVVTLVLPEQAADFRTLSRQAKIDATPQAIRPGARALDELVGEVADRVKPTMTQLQAASAPDRGESRSAQGGARRGQRGAPVIGGRSGGGGGGRSAGGRSGGGRSGAAHAPSSHAPAARRGGNAASPRTATTYTTSTPSAGGDAPRRSAAVDLSMRGQRRSGR